MTDLLAITTGDYRLLYISSVCGNKLTIKQFHSHLKLCPWLLFIYYSYYSNVENMYIKQ